MLFWITVDGRNVAIQAVNRKPRPYWRLAPYTIVYPTPKQREVRHTLAKGAHSAANKSLDDVDQSVQKEFANWEYTERPANRVEQGLKELYGNEADKVLTYISNQNYVSEKLKSPAYKHKVQQVVEAALIEA